MTPEERARMLHDAIHRAGGELHEERWVDEIWLGGPAERLIADALRDAERLGAAAMRETCVAAIRALPLDRLDALQQLTDQAQELGLYPSTEAR